MSHKQNKANLLILLAAAYYIGLSMGTHKLPFDLNHDKKIGIDDFKTAVNYLSSNK